LLIPLLLIVMACTENEEPQPQQTEQRKTVMEVIRSSDFDPRLGLAISQYNPLSDGLDYSGTNWTAFMPTTEALDEFLATMGYPDSLPGVSNVFAFKVFRYHFVKDYTYTSEQLGPTMYPLTVEAGFLKDVIKVNDDKDLVTGQEEPVVIEESDFMASNGVVHKVNKMLISPSMGELLNDIKGTNAETVFIHHEFEFLLQSIDLADAVPGIKDKLGEYLYGEEEHTLFAPTDTVYRALDIDRWSYSQTQWRSTLERHIVKGKVTADQIIDGAEFETLAGSMITVYIDPAGLNGIYIDYDGSYDPADPSAEELDARIEVIDGAVNSNGRIHYVDNFFN